MQSFRNYNSQGRYTYYTAASVVTEIKVHWQIRTLPFDFQPRTDPHSVRNKRERSETYCTTLGV